VGSQNIKNGAVASANLASGAAAANVGTLGGALSGTLPNPSLATGIVLQLASTGTTRKISFGTASVTFSASTSSAIATITHGLGATPALVIATPAGSNMWLSYSNLTGTTFDIQGFRDTLTTGTPPFGWIAIG